MIAHISEDGREQSVSEHLSGVAEIAEKEAEKLGLGNTAWICGIYHDLGKKNNNFNNYIRYSFAHGEDKSKSVPHSSAGAHYIYYDLLDDFEINDISDICREILAVVLASHHGVYDCVKLDGSHRSSINDRWAADENYKESVDNFKELFAKERYEEIAERIYQADKELKSFNEKIKQLAVKGKGESYFYQGCLVRLILSYLIYGDWKDTENFMSGYNEETTYNMQEVWSQCFKNYEKYMEALNSKNNSSDKIKRYRQEISQECAEAYEVLPGVYRMSVPTGGGKTLSSLNFALRHSIKYGKERIFYISPFLSILEQNSKVIRDVIDNDDLILEYHSNISHIDENSKKNAENKNSLAIDWDSPFILTTLVQFINTLFSDKLQCIRRMHWLANSVIIIDEVQAVPVRCINTFNLMINFLAYVCNATIILCTATQPALGGNAENGVGHKIIFDERKEIIGNVEKRFEQFERTRIIPAIKNKGYCTEDVRDFVAEICNKNNSVLVILNTKSAVKLLFDNIKDCIGDTYIYSLTTNMCPENRSNVISEIKDILDRIRGGSDERILVISTSLIEAGVDISFMTVIRALTGLDSIVQAAGRCNRQGECEYGDVYIINTNEHTSTLTDTVKGAKASKTLIDNLQRQDRIDKLFMPDSISNYYLEYYCDRKNEMDYCYNGYDGRTTLYKLLSSNRESVDECKKMKNDEAFNTKINQAFKTAWSTYKAIDDNTIGVIVPYKEGKKYCQDIRSARTVQEIKACLKKAQRYTINLYENKISELEKSGIISACDLYGSVYVLGEQFYDDNLGIVTDFQDYIF